VKIEIKHRFTGAVLFSLETESLKLCVEAAVKSEAYLRGAYLGGANLRDANLRGADLGDADLRDANLRGADLVGADLGGANLVGANLGDAYLGDAYLRGADLGGANLGGANLRDADLRGADLGGANLRGADLVGANLVGANLVGAKGINKYRCTPLLMLHDQIGKIRLYKLVTKKGEGPYNGGIIYRVGESYSVDDANCDDTRQCAAGINLATLDWCMKNWQKGYRILIAEFKAEDIAAVPIATDGKFRVHRCEIVAEKDLKEIGLVEDKK